MDIEEIIRRVQRKLGVEVDGKAGPVTWEAIYQEVVGTASKVSLYTPGLSVATISPVPLTPV